MKYYPRIDGLRFVAVTFVLFEHFAPFIIRFFEAGYFGVELFLFISGFLITTILLKSDKPFSKSYKSFIIRRSLRIFPVYYLLIFILMAFQFQAMKEHFLYLLTYTYNYAIVSLPFTYVMHLWSLALEEQFYLVWPFVVLPLRNKHNVLFAVVIIIMAACIAQFIFHVFPGMIKYNWTGTYPRMYGLAGGALIALLVDRGITFPPLLAGKWFELTVCLLVVIGIHIKSPAWLQVADLGAFFIVFKAVTTGFNIEAFNKFLTNRTIVTIGRLSYGIYLFHLPIGHFIDPYFDSVWHSINFKPLGIFQIIEWHAYIVKVPVYGALSFAVAYVSFNLVEKPCLRLKERFWKA